MGASERASDETQEDQDTELESRERVIHSVTQVSRDCTRMRDNSQSASQSVSLAEDNAASSDDDDDEPVISRRQVKETEWRSNCR